MGSIDKISQANDRYTVFKNGEVINFNERPMILKRTVVIVFTVYKSRRIFYNN